MQLLLAIIVTTLTGLGSASTASSIGLTAQITEITPNIWRYRSGTRNLYVAPDQQAEFRAVASAEILSKLTSCTHFVVVVHNPSGKTVFVDHGWIPELLYAQRFDLESLTGEPWAFTPGVIPGERAASMASVMLRPGEDVELHLMLAGTVHPTDAESTNDVPEDLFFTIDAVAKVLVVERPQIDEFATTSQIPLRGRGRLTVRRSLPPL